MPFPPDAVLLDTSRSEPEGEAEGALLFTDPDRVLVARALADVPTLLAEIDRLTSEGWHAAGYLAYEAGYAFERIAPPKPPAGPLAWFGVYRDVQRLSDAEIETLLAEGRSYRLSEPRFDLSRPAYRERIARIKRHIRAGDVYQINFTAPFRFAFGGDPIGLYRTLRRKQRVGFGALLRMSGDADSEAGESWVLSRSPELFFRRDDRRITARPMKGTAPRRPSGPEDAAQARWLTADEKNRAENLMIVDLLRNDLSVVAEEGSVRVPALFEAERYDTLWQMTSTVEATLRPGVRTADVVRALFPCGSVTGAPKIRAMQLIHEIEDGPRGVYCGAVGYVAPGGRAVFNVPIRTVVLRGGEGTMGSGSGVVWDSDPDAEYDECLLKARFLTDPPTPDFALLEALRWDDGYPHLDAHLDRLRRSAAYFGYPFDEPSLRDRLHETAADLPPGESHKIRLTLDRHGALDVTATALAEAPLALRRALVFPESADSSDPFLRHKTTHRPFYDRTLAWAQQRGADEAILVNERGEVTEGTRTNVFARIRGWLVTPPLASGGLGGVYRSHVLAEHVGAEERILSVDDLRTADALYLCNAVRGMQPVTLMS